MAGSGDWDDIDLVCGGDETTQFGPRKEGGTALYRVETVASIGSHGGSQEVPRCSAVCGRAAGAASAVGSPGEGQTASADHSGGGGVCVLVGRFVHLFDDACVTCNASFGLENTVEVCCWSADGTFVVVGDAAGLLYFIDAVTHQVLFSKDLFGAGSAPQGDRCFLSVGFAPSAAEGCADVVALAGSGKLVRISGINLQTVRIGIESSDSRAFQEVMAGLSVSSTNVGKQHHTAQVRGACTAEFQHAPAILTWGEGECALALWRTAAEQEGAQPMECVDSVSRQLRDTCLVQCCVFGDTLVTLDSTGSLSLWHFATLVRLATAPTGLVVDSVQVLDNAAGTSVPSTSATDETAACPQLLLVTRPVGDEPSEFKIVKAAPGFEPLYSLEVSPLATTVVSGCERDTLFIVECKADGEQGPSPGSNRLFVRCLTETLPTNRFYHLLHKGRFEEALGFARQFGLDMELVYRVRVTSILDRADKSAVPSIEQELMESLGTIEDDDEFMVDSCLQASLPDVPSTLSILEYALNRVHQKQGRRGSATTPGLGAPTATASSASSPPDEAWLIKARILGAIKRLGTFQLLMESGAPFDPVQWHHFRIADLVREVMTAFAHGRVASAVLVWNRHVHEYDLVSHLEAVLSSIPDQVGTYAVLPWLRTTLPYAVRQHHGLVLNWVLRRIEVMEATERPEWPQNGIDLIAAADPVLHLYRAGGAAPITDATATLGATTAPAASTTTTTTAATAASSASAPTTYIPIEFADRVCGYVDDDIEGPSDALAFEAAGRLATVRAKLQDVAHLRAEYDTRFVVPFEQHEPALVAAELLDRVKAPELVPGTVDELRPYLARHRLAFDAFLRDYVTESLRSAASLHANIVAAHERKCLALIGCIADTSKKLDATLELMRRVRVPWTAEVDALIETARGWGHARMAEFREQHRILHLRKMMLAYRITEFNLSDASLARGLMRHILADLDSPTAMEDALQVVGAYHHLSPQEAYVERAQNLAVHRGCGAARALVEGLQDDALFAAVAHEVLRWATTVIAEPVVFPGDEQQWRQAVELAELLATSLAARCPDTDAASAAGTRCTAADFKRIRCLEAEFGVRCAAEEYGDPAFRKALFARRLNSSPAEGGEALQGFESPRGHRLATLLRLPVTCRARAVVAHLRAEATADTRRPATAPATDALHELRAICDHLVEDAVEQQQGEQLQAAALDVIGGMVDVAERTGRSNPREAARLVQHLTTACPSSQLCDNVELFRCFDLACAVFEQCDADSLEAASEALSDAAGEATSASTFFAAATTSATAAGRSSVDARAEQLEADRRASRRRFFHEDGLMLDAAKVMPFALAYARSAIEAAGAATAAAPYEQLRIGGGQHASGTKAMAAVSQAARDLVLFLQEKRLAQISLRYALHAVGASAQAAACPTRDAAKVRENFDKGVLPMARSLVGDLHHTLLGKVLGAVQPDRSTALGHMASISMEGAFNVFRTSISATKRNYDRIAHLAGIGICFSWLWRQEAFHAECSGLSQNAAWWSRLSAAGVAFDRRQFEQQPEAYARRLLPLVLSAGDGGLSSALEFAANYGIGGDEVHLAFARILLTSATNPGSDGGAGSTTADPLRPRYPDVAKALLAVVDKEAAIAMLLDGCLGQISPYNYPRLRFALDLVQQLQQSSGKHEQAPLVRSGLTLLGILDHYERTGSPQPYERNFMAERFGAPPVHAPSPSAAACRRLPFHHFLLGDPWEVLRPELTLFTVAKLLPIAKLLALSQDEFYVVVTEKVMHLGQQQHMGAGGNPLSTSGPAPAPSTSPSSSREHGAGVAAVSFPAYAELEPILSKIVDHETAIMTAKMVADRLPLSQDKVLALEAAVAKTLEWTAALNASQAPDHELLDKAARIEERLTTVFKATCTQLDLTSHGMEGLLPLIRAPAELIGKMYEEYSVPQPGTVAVAPDALHCLVEGVAERYGLSAEKLRRFLIQKWLLTSSDEEAGPSVPATPSKLGGGSGAVPSLSLGSALDDPEPGAGQSPALAAAAAVLDVELGDLNLQRAVSMLRQQSPLDATVAYLLNFAHMEKSLKITPQARLRAFTALFSVASTEKICEVAEKTMCELRDHLLALIYVTRLEQVHVVLGPREFASSDKPGLIRGLWRDHRHELKAVRVVADLCLEFEVYDSALWNGVLQQLLKCGDLKYLSHVLVRVAGVSALWHVPALPKVWHEVLHSASLDWLCTANASESQALAELVELMLRSPFVLKCDLKQLMNRCLNAGDLPSAAICAAMLPEAEEQKRCFAEVTGPDGVFAVLQGLHGRDSAMVDKVKAMCFDAVDGQRLYAQVLGSPHFNGFVRHLLSTDRIQGIFNASIQARRFGPAAQLVEQYCLLYPASEVAQQQSSLPGDGPLEPCLSYAVSKGLDRSVQIVRAQMVEEESQAQQDDDGDAPHPIPSGA